jgi:hypothetical protein
MCPSKKLPIYDEKTDNDHNTFLFAVIFLVGEKEINRAIWIWKWDAFLAHIRWKVLL